MCLCFSVWCVVFSLCSVLGSVWCVIGSAVDMKSNEEEEDIPEVDITINNVVSTFRTRCHLNLRQIATQGFNVVYKRELGVMYSFLSGITVSSHSCVSDCQ